MPNAYCINAYYNLVTFEFIASITGFSDLRLICARNPHIVHLGLLPPAPPRPMTMGSTTPPPSPQPPCLALPVEWSEPEAGGKGENWHDFLPRHKLCNCNTTPNKFEAGQLN